MQHNEFSLVNAMNITASVFINDDECGLHNDEKILLEILFSQCLRHGICVIMRQNGAVR